MEIELSNPSAPVLSLNRRNRAQTTFFRELFLGSSLSTSRIGVSELFSWEVVDRLRIDPSSSTMWISFPGLMIWLRESANEISLQYNEDIVFFSCCEYDGGEDELL